MTNKSLKFILFLIQTRTEINSMKIHLQYYYSLLDKLDTKFLTIVYHHQEFSMTSSLSAFIFTSEISCKIFQNNILNY